MNQEMVKVGRWLNILNEATATTNAPALATDGVALPVNLAGKNVVIRFRHSATGARTFTVALYGYCAGEVNASNEAIANTAGWVELREVESLASTAVNGSICQAYESLTAFSRLYARVTAISGTSCKVSVALGLTEE
jgi:hypothetical protein